MVFKSRHQIVRRAKGFGYTLQPILLFSILITFFASIYLSSILLDEISAGHDVKQQIIKAQQEQEIQASSCEVTRKFCTLHNKSDDRIMIGMAAVPHTASTTTDAIFEAREKSWNTSLPIMERGFNCPSKEQKIVATPHQCHNKNTKDTTITAFDCIIDKMTYKYKEHSNFDLLTKFGKNTIFTTLRKPEQMVLSHFRERLQWDWVYNDLYPTDNITSINVEEFVVKAWYRHNLFVKILSTETQLIFRDQSNLKPSKEESDYQNSLGKDSVWLRTAVQRLKSMPFFGLFHRMQESFELFSFHLCIPIHTDRAKDHKKKARVVSKKLEDIVDKYFVLDRLFLEEAEILFDSLLADMRKKKKNGMICDVGSILGNEYRNKDFQIGLMCVD